MAWRGWQRVVVRRGSALLVCSGLSLLIVSFFLATGMAVGRLIDDGVSSAVRQASVSAPANRDGRISAVLQDADFLEDLRSGAVFRRFKEAQKASIFGQIPIDVQGPTESRRERAKNRNGSRTYRTVCVRLCDGYYFPISTATTRSRFAKDDRACSRRCNSPARLYAYPTAGGSPDKMVDIKGRAYTDLSTAFLYRAKYNASCTCRPHPWEPDALKAHKLYATKAWQRKARRLARANTAKARRRSRIARRDRRPWKARPYGLGVGASAAVGYTPGLVGSGVSPKVAGFKQRASGLGAGRRKSARRTSRSLRRRKQSWTQRVLAGPDS